MTATNHALTGGLIALMIHGLWVAIPLAFISHYLLDSLPHFGQEQNPDFIKTKTFQRILTIDISVCILFAIVLAVLHPHLWWFVILCAFTATSPDAMWLPDFIAQKHHKAGLPLKNRSFLVRLHGWVQWYQRPQGAFVEIAWFLAVGSIFLQRIG